MDIELKHGEARGITLPKEPGILILDYHVSGNSFAGHITMWNGQQTVDDTFDLQGITESGVHRSQMEVSFYKLPCFKTMPRVKNNTP